MSYDYRRRTREEAPAASAQQPAGRLVMGVQPVREAVRVWTTQLSAVYIEHRPNPRLAALAQFARDQGITVEEKSRYDIERLCGKQMHQGVLAWAPALPLFEMNDVLARPDLGAIALDGVVDPQNFGAVIRSAVGISRAPILWGESASAPLTPATFRASAGAIEHAQLCRVRSLHGALAEAAGRGISVVGLAPDARDAFHELDLSGPTIIVIGSEEKGMGRAVRRSCTQLARIGQSGAIQSLNASVAAGICLHAMMVARSHPPT